MPTRTTRISSWAPSSSLVKASATTYSATASLTPTKRSNLQAAKTLSNNSNMSTSRRSLLSQECTSGQFQDLDLSWPSHWYTSPASLWTPSMQLCPTTLDTRALCLSKNLIRRLMRQWKNKRRPKNKQLESNMYQKKKNGNFMSCQLSELS